MTSNKDMLENYFTDRWMKVVGADDVTKGFDTVSDHLIYIPESLRNARQDHSP